MATGTFVQHNFIICVAQSVVHKEIVDSAFANWRLMVRRYGQDGLPPIMVPGLPVWEQRAESTSSAAPNSAIVMVAF